MTGSLEDRAVVVTGGAGALGQAVSAALVEVGAHVHIPLLEAKPPASFGLAGHAQIHTEHGVDLSDERAAVDYFAGVPRPWATINLAGGFAMAPLVETSLADFERMWRMNVVSCFLSCRESVRRMREADEGGRIVNVAARPALIPTPGMIAYTAAKSGVAALTRALAEELADEKIWVNAIAPSIIDTPVNRAAMPDADHDRWPSTEALAQTILSLASPDNRCARGAVVPVYGRS
ncbi:Cyclopentanol dehydrogenase [Enhygromyxa salina]|uniref:Cyclopentanol dehydrogenase n=1 Tax=Enhygromyxa salina TaxID=215803 RepID=A0A2S9XK12_9BACT|nr:SDR family NAD(P)-dependent oxidoreductase [Enhygromyxa salina]PRP93193.1 Cyclopentanol dehydrogenase [Enhygromyxa salina]